MTDPPKRPGFWRSFPCLLISWHSWGPGQPSGLPGIEWRRCDRCGKTAMAPSKMSWRDWVLVMVLPAIFIVGSILIGLRNGWS